MTEYTIRPIRAHEWREIRALRLTALKDESAPLAFVESYEEAATQPDEFWQARAQGSSDAAGPQAGACQFVAVADNGMWVGTSVALIEKAGEQDFEGKTIERSGGHVVGVFLQPEHRGKGVIGSLLDASLDWLRQRKLTGVRLYVHADNIRARRAYEKAGFTATGESFHGSLGPEIEMARVL
ncbi:GNAT family N-acetyltransferase [Micromonospora krabiensis]|uniref:Ribosomal protein S18 acetylase RimI n=1 Tax=Micromonospora krabiensis TaxID=307121 RepID=A0A1C3N1N1_9ACTN|nr:GNAT family N-acetyltransferase [Micromonospora krabiensis]SBV26490.1 Ribosomal protein S18 acetylase RimI [Micromonospora krabiensis]